MQPIDEQPTDHLLSGVWVSTSYRLCWILQACQPQLLLLQLELQVALFHNLGRLGQSTTGAIPCQPAASTLTNSATTESNRTVGVTQITAHSDA